MWSLLQQIKSHSYASPEYQQENQRRDDFSDLPRTLNYTNIRIGNLQMITLLPFAWTTQAPMISEKPAILVTRVKLPVSPYGLCRHRRSRRAENFSLSYPLSYNLHWYYPHINCQETNSGNRYIGAFIAGENFPLCYMIKSVGDDAQLIINELCAFINWNID